MLDKLVYTFKKINQFFEKKQKVLFPIIVIVFGAIIYISLKSLPENSFNNVNWLPFIFICLTLPSSFIISAMEHYTQSKHTTKFYSFNESYKIAVASRAANILPLPGGMILKTSNLVDKGSSVSSSLYSSACIGITWISTSLLIATIIFGLLASKTIVSIMFIVTLIFSYLTYLTFKKLQIDNKSSFMKKILFIEMLGSMLSAFRLGLFSVTFTTFSFIQGASLGSAASLSASVSFVPSGLGIQESIAGILGSLAGITFASGAIITLLARIMNLGFAGISILMIQTYERLKNGK